MNIMGQAEYQKKWREKNKDYLRNYQRKWASKNREKRRISVRIWTEKNRERKNRTMREQNRILKIEVLTHYGGNPPKCVCCRESHIEFLTIDHISNNGSEHRRKLKIKGGNMFYRWLKKNNYPNGYRVLCLNCNFSLGHYGYCPHNGVMK